MNVVGLAIARAGWVVLHGGAWVARSSFSNTVKAMFSRLLSRAGLATLANASRWILKYGGITALGVLLEYMITGRSLSESDALALVKQRGLDALGTKRDEDGQAFLLRALELYKDKIPDPEDRQKLAEFLSRPPAATDVPAAGGRDDKLAAQARSEGGPVSRDAVYRSSGGVTDALAAIREIQKAVRVVRNQNLHPIASVMRAYNTLGEYSERDVELVEEITNG